MISSCHDVRVEHVAAFDGACNQTERLAERGSHRRAVSAASRTSTTPLPCLDVGGVVPDQYACDCVKLCRPLIS